MFSQSDGRAIISRLRFQRIEIQHIDFKFTSCMQFNKKRIIHLQPPSLVVFDSTLFSAINNASSGKRACQQIPQYTSCFHFCVYMYLWANVNEGKYSEQRLQPTTNVCLQPRIICIPFVFCFFLFFLTPNCLCLSSPLPSNRKGPIFVTHSLFATN